MVLALNIIPIIFLLGFSNSVQANGIPELIAPSSPKDIQEIEVRALIERTIGKDGAKYFEVAIDWKLEHRSYKLSKGENNKVYIVGYDGISVAKAFHTYLKYYLKHDITWTNPNVTLPNNLELPEAQLFSKSESPIIYYQNVCTWGYSFAWWAWPMWRRHIDWMAMMGISLTIAPVQEEIWYNVYKDLGLSDNNINDYFAGPAFLPWLRMGNIHGWGGPLSKSYRTWQSLLQKNIIDAERNLGMSVALPAFAGHVPKSIANLYPNTKFTTLNRWNKFPDKYCCALFIDPADDLFQKIAGKFLKATIDLYGTNHIYFTDPFNELEPPSSDPNYMRNASQKIYQSMQQVDNDAIWLLQGWMFVTNVFWSKDLIKAFLTAVPTGKLLVLDLQSEQFPQYERTNSYEGHAFIWCMLHNFGGTLGMHGSAEIINTRIQEARMMDNSSMIGVGITPEGIYQNYIIYALTMERAWIKNNFNLTYWFNVYSDNHYGVENKSLQLYWNILRKSVYSFYSLIKLRGKYGITRRPALNLKPWIWYNQTNIEEAYHLLLISNDSIPDSHYKGYEHDLVDISRQYLQVKFDELYINLIQAYKKRQITVYNFLAKLMLQIFDNLELILKTNENFLLGPWLESAKFWGSTIEEKELIEMNARNQITSWGPEGQIVDYACKQWSGLVRDYYKQRWSLFIDMVSDCLHNNEKFNNTLFKYKVSNLIEKPFTIEKLYYPTEPYGNTYEVARDIFNKWQYYSSSEIYKNCMKVNVKRI